MDKETRQARWQTLWETEVWKKWHLVERNPQLWKYLHLLCPDENDKSGIFLLPMCGKSVDLKLLYEAGFNVVGIEFCEIVVQQFFTENDLTYEVVHHSDEYKVFTTLDSRLKVVCGDLLGLTKDVLGGVPVKMIWDRGAMGSIEKELKKKYAQVMQSLFGDSPVRYLLDCWEYQDWYTSIPPHNCPVEMIRDLYGDNFEIEEIERTENKVKAASMNATTAYKLTYLMLRKNKAVHE